MANHSSPSYVDELFNRILDADHQWGPLLFLRPAIAERFGVVRVLVISVLVGGAFGLPGSILLGLGARASHRAPLPVFVFPLVLTAVYFWLCQMSVVPAWNRRALRLSKRNFITSPSERP